MAKFRKIYTSFWQNEYIQEEMTPEEKYFYLYLMTNEKTTQIGLYKISKKQIAFDLGYTVEKVESLVERFCEYHDLIRYDENTKELVLLKWSRHNLVRGGKPVEDLIKSELLKVRNKEFLKYVVDDSPNNNLKIIIENFIATNQIEFIASKDWKREYIRQRENNKCFYTDIELEEDFHINRIIAKVNGGGEEIENLVACSKEFSKDKSADSFIITCKKYNIDYGDIEYKIKMMKEFEKERYISNISYKVAIQNKIFSINSIRNYLNTIRKQKKQLFENNDSLDEKLPVIEKAQNEDKDNKINVSYDTCTRKKKEEIRTKNIYKEKIYKKEKILEYINSLKKSDEVKNKIIEFYSYRKKIKKNFKTTRGIDNLLNQSYDSDDHFIACINYAMDHEYIGVKPEYVKGVVTNGTNKYTRNSSKTNIKPNYGTGFDDFN